MAEHTLWTCDRCRRTERVTVGGKPAHWSAVTVEPIPHGPFLTHRVPTRYDLCPPCIADVDRLLRDASTTVIRQRASSGT